MTKNFILFTAFPDPENQEQHYKTQWSTYKLTQNYGLKQ
ncbi:hypothetical protein SAMN05444274_105247 [Mariniphaga anaerophila]|uniref:Uncharacterized protein n=1 Tax=Mariniphaga anaerophila TaxID=1484053 RepID=A0A1M5BPC3_9BACT|nr:hypothetical protein SAMN05444274_105247 [Mariniphaga anaerophila]